MTTSLRSSLDALTKAKLLELAGRFGVEIAASRAKPQVIDALAKTPGITLERLLRTFSLDELKALCRHLDLDATARAKQILIDRIQASMGVVVEVSGPAVAGMTEYEPTGASATKLRLQRFALAAAGGYRDRDADLRFASDLIRCFGWGVDDSLPAEIPAQIRVVEQGKGTTQRLSALLRERRALVEVIERSRSTREAWAALIPSLIQLTPPPQYIVLTNQRDLELYDLVRSRTEPRLAIPVDQLPKYSEAFPFLTRDWSPGSTPQIINVERVSKEVADLVAKVYRSFKAEHPKRPDEVIRFTLQCIIAMFAEDIGLLPRQHFTGLLYQAASQGDAEARLRKLFKSMSTPWDGVRPVRHFNGGLFKTPVSLPINAAQLTALTKAAEADWTYVDPHIFGAVFQGIMDEDERHATGAHYTSKDDIMRVVGPTIVEPWRRRISEATTLSQLQALRKELVGFRVLDPACGSGNFLYIAYRELYRLETEILARMQEFASVADKAHAWGSGIPTTNFHGIDINPFAVELARATLNIAKKIAFDERHQVVVERFKQIEMELDPSLPLDNLEKNIFCADALFVDWPKVEAIVGNPPILGDRKIRAELGDAYIGRLKDVSGVTGVVDLSCYWFRKAHDHLPAGGRAGLVGTSGLRVGKARQAALDYIVDKGGTITNAVSSTPWSGDAAVDVCMVNWIHGPSSSPCQLTVNDRQYNRAKIPTHLQLHNDVNAARKLRANMHGTSRGVTFATDAFRSDSGSTFSFPTSILRPIATGTEVLTGASTRVPTSCIYLSEHPTEDAVANATGDAFPKIKQRLHPAVREKADGYEGWLQRWWQPWCPREAFFSKTASMQRYIACASPQSRPIFVFLSTQFVATDTMQVFAFADDYAFGIVQSRMHWEWVKAKGGKVRADYRYTADVWRTFPWPQQVTEDLVVDVAVASRALRQIRRELMDANGWSLRALYQAADIPGPHPLKVAQARLDDAVANAYGIPSGQDPLEFLLELNLALAEDEELGHLIAGPGLPPELAPADPRWSSTDCIEPPEIDHG